LDQRRFDLLFLDTDWQFLDNICVMCALG
jgi:hypothetical protein